MTFTKQCFSIFEHIGSLISAHFNLSFIHICLELRHTFFAIMVNEMGSVRAESRMIQTSPHTL